jgi:hypothetical protein
MWGRRAYVSVLGGFAAAVTLVAAGCGDSSPAPVVSVSGASGASGAGGSSALTKAEFIKQADSICSEANSAIASLSGGASIDPTTQASQELEITRSELQSLQSLTPPSESASTLKDFLAAMKNEVDALTNLSSAVASGGDTSTADAELAGAKSNAQAAATSYGFQDCANAQSRPTQPGGTVTTTPVPTTTVPVTPTTTPTVAPTVPTTVTPPPPPPSGGTGSAPPSGGTGGGSTGGGAGNGGTGGTGGVSP